MCALHEDHKTSLRGDDTQQGASEAIKSFIGKGEMAKDGRHAYIIRIHTYYISTIRLLCL